MHLTIATGWKTCLVVSAEIMLGNVKNNLQYQLVMRFMSKIILFRCGNVAAILELDEHLQVRNNILFLHGDTV